MKTIDMELNIDDRVWVQEYDSDGEPLRLRYAKVLVLYLTRRNLRKYGKLSGRATEG